MWCQSGRSVKVDLNVCPCVRVCAGACAGACAYVSVDLCFICNYESIGMLIKSLIIKISIYYFSGLFLKK